MCKEISDVCLEHNLPLSVEVFSVDPAEVYKDAIDLVENISNKISVKVPIEMKYLPTIKK